MPAYIPQIGPSDVWTPTAISPLPGGPLNPLGLPNPGVVPRNPRSPMSLEDQGFDPLLEYYIPRMTGTSSIMYRAGGRAPDTPPLPAAERRGQIIKPADLAARVASGKFDPLKDLYLDPVDGPIPFAITRTEIEGGQERITFSASRLPPIEHERARQMRIAGLSQGHRSTRLASLAQRRTALSGLGDTLGAGSPQLGARASLSGI